MIPITKVELAPETETRVLDVLRSGQLAQGAVVAELEVMFAEAHQVKHAVAVNNGTTALVLAMQALGIGPEDEVITTPFTFVATLNAILQAGATAVFADIGDDYNIDPSKVAPLVNVRTKAIMPVHLYGYMADMAALSAIANPHNLQIVEDAAQAVGAEFHGTMAGATGVGCFSMYATKNISTGEGGMITTNSDELDDRLRLLRNQGMRARYQYEVAGHNYRLTNLAAAVGIPQVKRLGEINTARKRNADALRQGLADIDGIVLPPAVKDGQTHVYHQFTIRVPPGGKLSRENFVDTLVDEGVGCGIYYPKVVFDYDCYRSDARVMVTDVPNATKIASEVVSLPVHPFLTDQELHTICATVRKILS